MLHILLSKSNNWNKSNNSIKEKIKFLLQNQWNNFFKKHVDVDHSFIPQMYEEKMNSLLKSTKKYNFQRKKQIHLEG